jgi:hypothetical protein
MGLSLHEFRDDFAWFKLPNGSEFEIFAATDLNTVISLRRLPWRANPTQTG